MLKKTKEQGVKAIVFTIDAPKLGTRERDERNNFKMPDNLSLGNFNPTCFGPSPTLYCVNNSPNFSVIFSWVKLVFTKCLFFLDNPSAFL